MSARLAIGALGVLCALPLAAGAQELPRFDVERLQLDPSARASLVVGDGEVGPRGALRFSAAVQVENDPLVQRADGSYRGGGLGSSTAQVTSDVVLDRVSVSYALSWAPLDCLELYLRLPYVLHQGSDLTGDAAPADQGLGTPSAGLRWGVVAQRDGAPVSIAFAADLFPPWGTPRAAAGNPGNSFAFAPRIEVGRRFERFVLAGEARALFRSSPVPVGPDRMDAEFGGGLAAATTGRLRAEISLSGSVNQNDVGRELELLAGLRASAGLLEIFALGGPGFLSAPGTPRWRAIAGIAFAGGGLGRADRPTNFPGPTAPRGDPGAGSRPQQAAPNPSAEERSP